LHKFPDGFEGFSELQALQVHVGTGNDLANTISGNTAGNVLDGGAGADTLQGGAGNDTYIVDDTGDEVIEGQGEGTDTVKASVSYALPGNVEKLTLVGSDSVEATGNALDNVITGNAVASLLAGGEGDDVYVVQANDTIVERDGEGNDLVKASVSFTLAEHVERLTLTGAAEIDGTGNALDNVLTGNAAANRLYGAGGVSYSKEAEQRLQRYEKHGFGNLPINIARQTCGDVIIAVNISTPPLKRDEITSALSIVAQLINFLGKDTVDRQLADMTPRDVLISPELGTITSGSFDRQGEAIAIGEAAARLFVASGPVSELRGLHEFRPDRGWLYATTSLDGRTVHTNGRVPACMQCHADAPHDRLFGLQDVKR